MLVELSLPTKCDPSLKMWCPQSVAWVNRQQGVSVWTSLLCPEPSDEPWCQCEWASSTPRGALTIQTLAHCGYKQSKTHCLFPCQRPCALFFPSWRVFLHVRSVFSSASSQSLRYISAVDLCTSKKSPVCTFPSLCMVAVEMPQCWVFQAYCTQTSKYPQPFSMDKEWIVLIDSFDLVISSVAFSSGSQICSRYWRTGQH